MFSPINFEKSARVLVILAGSTFLVSCSRPVSPKTKERFNTIIPKPVSATATGNAFVLTKETSIVIDGEDQGIKTVAQYLADKLRPATGFDPEIKPGPVGDDENAIYLSLSGGDAKWGNEGYQITVTPEQVKLTANKPAGLFMGIQTLRQLLPEEIEHQGVQNNDWEIATGTIVDYPQYAWRGSMLDVARHFFSVEDVKRYIDLISYYKMNILHLHLSDDQGWRIEIKSWPNLTKIGGSTQVGGGKGGFYTQEQYKDIVAYAQSRHVTIVPEIDLPGHINSALASYPELNAGPPIVREKGNKEKPVAGQLYTGIEVGFSTLHIKKEATFRFVNDVLGELAAMTPGPYLHIGGDEAAVTKKEDYIQFINRFKTIVASHQKKMIGWEEIAQGDIDSTVLVQHWHSEAYAKLAADKGAKLIYSPSKKVYLDMQYDSTTKLGLHWAAYIEADSSYMWDPATRVPGIDASQIHGVEAPLWTETILTMDDIEYMIFPRLPGIAEIGWTASANRNWEEYKTRIGKQGKRWKEMDINYYQSPLIQWVD
jgi:hexosaminidase